MKHRRGGRGLIRRGKAAQRFVSKGSGKFQGWRSKNTFKICLAMTHRVLLLTYSVTFCACTFPILEAQLNVGLVPGGSTNPHESSVVRNAATYILPKRNRAISWIHDNLPNLTNPPFQSHKKMKTTQTQTFISVNCSMSSTSVH